MIANPEQFGAWLADNEARPRFESAIRVSCAEILRGHSPRCHTLVEAPGARKLPEYDAINAAAALAGY